jgi:hypothetical protein
MSDVMGGAELLYKLAIGLACLLAVIGATALAPSAKLSTRRFDYLLVSLWILTRLGVYGLVFFVLRMEVTSDVSIYYYSQGREAMLGRILYRDFASAYSPAFPYLIALILGLWDSAKAIVLASILIDGVNFAVWLTVARRLWSEPVCRRMALFYLLSTLPILNVAVAGQNQVWVSLLLGTAVLLYQQGKPALSAFFVGLPLVLVKLLPLLYLAGFLRWRSNPLRTIASALLVPALLFAVLALRGIDVLQPLKLQESRVTSGNIPYLLSSVIRFDGGWTSTLMQVFSLVVLAVVGLYLFTRRENLDAEQIIRGLVILTLTCALVNKKFYSNYLVMVFAPLCSVAAMDASSLAAAFRFGFFNIVAALEPSLWFRLLRADEHKSLMWQMIPALRAANELWRLWLFSGVEATLLGFYIYYLLKAWRLFHARPERSTVSALSTGSVEMLVTAHTLAQ